MAHGDLKLVVGTDYCDLRKILGITHAMILYPTGTNMTTKPKEANERKMILVCDVPHGLAGGVQLNLMCNYTNQKNK